MATLTKIVTGMEKGPEAIQGNFEKLNQDTGIVSVTMVGAVKSLYSWNVPSAHRINGKVHLTGGIKATATLPVTTQILSMPDDFMPDDGTIYTFCRNDSTNGIFPIYINDGGVFLGQELGNDFNLDFSNIYYPGKEIK